RQAGADWASATGLWPCRGDQRPGFCDDRRTVAFRPVGARRGVWDAAHPARFGKRGFRPLGSLAEGQFLSQINLLLARPPREPARGEPGPVRVSLGAVEDDCMINLSIPRDEHEMKPRITVVGVGGAGGNAVNNMIRSNLIGCEFVVCNTDAQALQQSTA